jgi:hypothetical protein
MTGFVPSLHVTKLSLRFNNQHTCLGARVY